MFQSKALLLGQPDGTYLVRRSSQPGYIQFVGIFVPLLRGPDHTQHTHSLLRLFHCRCYSIDVVVGGLYLPILVLPDTAHGGVICSKVPCLDISEQKYPDLDALIKAQSGTHTLVAH